MKLPPMRRVNAPYAQDLIGPLLVFAAAMQLRVYAVEAEKFRA